MESITQDEALERVQRVSLKVILVPVYVNYLSALSALELETLRIRREKLCSSFAKKMPEISKALNLFLVEPVAHNHRMLNFLLSTMLERRNPENLLFLKCR